MVRLSVHTAMMFFLTCYSLFHLLLLLGLCLFALLRFAVLLNLVADGYTLTGTDKFRQIGVEGMVWETCHAQGRTVFLFALGVAREGDAQDVGGFDGIVLVGLVEVTATEQEHRIRVLLLQVVVLTEDRRHDDGLVAVTLLLLGLGGILLHLATLRCQHICIEDGGKVGLVFLLVVGKPEALPL